MRAVLALAFVLAACGDDIRGNITIGAPEAWQAAVYDMARMTDYNGIALGHGGDFHIELQIDPGVPTEGYEIDRGPTSGSYIVSASNLLGAQYGLSAALENLGFRFRHPFDTYKPREPKDQGTPLGVVHQPQIAVRGMQLHTLHPIESYFAFWEPSPENRYDAKRIIDWIIKNRGNYLHWVALDDIMDPAIHAAWQTYTRELIDYAHSRGVRVGINIQLFGASNLQLAFDLHDDDTETVAQSISERLPLITQDLPFDVIELSFGEFFGAEPQKLIDGIDELAKQAHVLAPQAEVRAFVHVGAKQRVDYMGENLIYYFLVKFADPSVIPDVHTVMYYDLYDDAGGAYQHDNFDEHKQFLLDYMCAGKPIGYSPESAYWVAFDDSVPTYLPLYVYSRWRDIEGISKEGCGPLPAHILFSTGWEWGYWLNDVTIMHDAYEHADSPEALIADAFKPDLGSKAAEVVSQLVTEQKTALIDERLAAYMASRDVIIDAGRKLDPPVISQPDRVQFDQLVDGTAGVDSFEANVLVPLAAHADALAALDNKLDALDLPDSRWARELRDGFAVDRVRAAFILEAYRAVVAHVRGDDAAAQAAYAKAAARYADAKPIIHGRHADLHDTHGRRLVDKTPNRTEYQYGYLFHADIVCYWRRELTQVGAILGNTSETPPGCLFGTDQAD